MSKKQKYGQSKKTRKRQRIEKKKRKFLSGATVVSTILISTGPAWADISSTALPTGASVASGNVSVSQTGPNMQVTQTSDKAIINWSTFDIGSSASVNFNQPHSSSIALNRVLSATPSTINGKLTSNGQVWVINPSGVVFGAGAAVNVGGLVASTMDIADDDFLAGKAQFKRGSSTGAVVNKGSITAADGGLIALLAPEVCNEGIITARLGTVVLAAGEKVVLSLDSSDGLVTVQVDPAQVKTLVENKLMIVAESGHVVLSAKAASTLLGAVIKNTGTIEASSLTNKGGVIELGGGDEITSTGTLNANGTSGGTIKVAAAETGAANVGGSVSATGSTGVGGKITVTGDAVAITDNANLDASGATGGGKINAGGSWQALDTTVQEATKTTVAATAKLSANATQKGDGGEIVVRSSVTNKNATTSAQGTFSAKGGPNGGNGGRIETSGHYLDVTNAKGSAAATEGAAGLWLFDPYSIVISDSGSTSATANTTATSATQLLTSSINSLLNNGTSVTITANTGSDIGDIIVSGNISKTTGGDASLTLNATDSITINNPIVSTTGALTLNLNADTDHNGTGIILLYNNISTNGGAVNFGTGVKASVNGVSTLVGGDVYVGYVGNSSSNSNATTIATNGGAVTINGQMILANPNGLAINTSGGNVTFASLLDSGDSYTPVYSYQISWGNAVTGAASGGGGNTGDTYLATVTSRLEGAVVTMTTYVTSGSNTCTTSCDYQASWLGAKRRTDTSTNDTWRWVTGPEGLQDSGKGLKFFKQNGSDTANGSGGSAINGAYTNWNGSTEPNNYQGPNLTTCTECVMQTIGSTGLWNDLSGASSKDVNYYVIEKNLANSPVTINAGSGTVAFEGSVGSNRALSSLTVAANTITIKGSSVNTTGAQTYNGNVGIDSASTTLNVANTGFTLGSGYSITNAHGAAASLTIAAGGDISLGAGSSIASSSGTFGVNLVTNSGGTINLGANSSISSNGGVIVLQGDNVTTSTGASLTSGGSGLLTIKPVTTGRTLGVGSNATGSLLLSDALLANTIAANGFTQVTLGSNITGAANVVGTLTLGNSTVVESKGNITLGDNTTLNLGTNYFGLALDTSNSSATESSSTTITAGGLRLAGVTSDFTLNNGTHYITTLAGSVKTLSFTNAQSLTLGLLGAYGGIHATGNAFIQTTGASSDLSLNYSVVTTGGSIELVAGRNFINNVGTTGIQATGYGGRYFVYSTSPSATTEGVTGYSKHYNQSYTGTTPSYASSGSWFFYSTAPVITVTPTSTSITYGTSDPTISATYSGLIDGDTSSVLTGSAHFATAAATLSNAGYRSAGNYALTTTDLGTLANSLGYTFAIGSSSSALTVTPKALTVSSVSASNKVYDATTAATILSNSFSGLFSHDVATVSSSGTFSDKNVGNGKTVTATSFTLSGADAANYSVTTPSLTTTANITPATLIYSADPTTVYVGFPIGTLTGSVKGLLGSDTVASDTTGALVWTTPLTDSNAVGSYAINGSGLSAANYVFAQDPTNATALSVSVLPQQQILNVVTQAAEKQETSASMPPTVTSGTSTAQNVSVTSASLNIGGGTTSVSTGTTPVTTTTPPVSTTGNTTSSGTSSHVGMVISSTNAGETATLIIGEGTNVSSSPVPTTTNAGGGASVTPSTPSAPSSPPAVSTPSNETATPAKTVAPSSTPAPSGGVTLEVVASQASVVAPNTKQAVAVVGSTSSFSFSLNTAVIQENIGDIKGDKTVARMADGGPLPKWLTYDKASKTFSAVNVPSGGLPLDVRISFVDKLDGSKPVRTLNLTITH